MEQRYSIACAWTRLALVNMTVNPMLLVIHEGHELHYMAPHTRSGKPDSRLCCCAACAGVPISWVVQTHGWDMYFLTLLGSCAVVVTLLAPTLNLKSREQVDSAKEK